jgi:ferric-dicitrate binding protein FerR (iron transport regulator)
MSEHTTTTSEPEISPELNRALEETFRKISPPDGGITSCKARIANAGDQSGSPLIQPAVYTSAAAVVLVTISIALMMNYLASSKTSEPLFIAGQEITLPDGTHLAISKDSSFKIQETKRELVLEKGWVRINCPANSPGKFKIIAPTNTLINSGSDFIMGYGDQKSPVHKIFSVSGNIELITLK